MFPVSLGLLLLVMELFLWVVLFGSLVLVSVGLASGLFLLPVDLILLFVVWINIVARNCTAGVLGDDGIIAAEKYFLDEGYWIECVLLDGNYGLCCC